MPTVPCGVQVRGGLYFGAVSMQRGSSAIMKGSPGQKPSEATQYSVPECTRTNCSTSASPLSLRDEFGIGLLLRDLGAVVIHRFLRPGVAIDGREIEQPAVELDVI